MRSVWSLTDPVELPLEETSTREDHEPADNFEFMLSDRSLYWNEEDTDIDILKKFGILTRKKNVSIKNTHAFMGAPTHFSLIVILLFLE